MVSFTDAVSYVVYKNPVSQITLGGLGKLAGATVSISKQKVFLRRNTRQMLSGRNY